MVYHMVRRACGSAKAFLISGIALLTASCAIPFTTETEPTTLVIPISSTFLTGYRENRVELPAEALRDGIRYDEVRFHYRATTESDLDADVEIWISDDQTTDNDYDTENDDMIVDIRLSSGETKSGWASSEALVRALNAQQQYIVIGGFARSLTGGRSVTITVYAEITGSVLPAAGL